MSQGPEPYHPILTPEEVARVKGEPIDYMRWPHAKCGVCGAQLQKGASVIRSEMGLAHWPSCP